MIHLCVVWRNNKWVVTSSDTVTFQEEVHFALREYYEKWAVRYWTDREIVAYVNEGMKEARTLQDNNVDIFLGDITHKLQYIEELAKRRQ